MLQKIKHFLSPENEVAYSHPVARFIPTIALQILEGAVWLAIILNLLKAAIG
jgi:hypothetical protein